MSSLKNSNYTSTLYNQNPEKAFKNGQNDSAILKGKGYVLHKQFLPKEMLLKVQHESKTKIGFSHRNTYFFSIYGYPAGQPSSDINDLSNYVIETSSSVLSGNHLNDTACSSLLVSESFKSYLCGLFNFPTVHYFWYPEAAVSLTYMKQGDICDWHFDKHDIVCILPIHQAKLGGEIDIAPYARQNKNIIKSLLTSESKGYVSPNLNIGDLLILNGKESMHRVRRLISNELRVSLLLSYDRRESSSLPKKHKKVRYGESTVE